ncbi:AraC family transcriptional regulator [Flavobacterium sp. HXWNR69]|uniref:AraC family transcriptional regulator n=1 Tax=Flavobacterium fragile TaxID=2949085 RepID=A0ABT0THZ6_9FLAO|nr:AraC family transcriptional regulator [Flavobacterium sp. HXWNR69]MCL9770578.1 AraC family transcriptional regulator [Flavobacterium sp. HXWNR69]
MIESLLLFSTGLIGLLSIIQIFMRSKANFNSNIYLIIIFGIIIMRFLVIGFFSLFDVNKLNEILDRYNNFLIAVIPLTFLYFKNLVLSKGKFVVDGLIHFVVPFLFIVTDFLDDKGFVEIRYKNIIFLCFFLIYIIFYLILDFMILQKRIWSKKSAIRFINDQNQLISKWTHYLFILLLLMAIRLMISIFLEVTSNHYDYGKSNLWIAALIWLSVFLRLLIFPEILSGYLYFSVKKNEVTSAYASKVIWKKDIEDEIINIQDLKLQNKIQDLIPGYMILLDNLKHNSTLFKDPKISLGDLAYKINIPKSHLTFLFKYYAHISFSEFKKLIRVEQALQLIESGYLKQTTFNSLAKDVGFISYNTFFTSFKEIVGITPQEFYTSYQIHQRSTSK